MGKRKMDKGLAAKAVEYNQAMVDIREAMAEWIPKLNLEKWGISSRFDTGNNPDCQNALATVNPQWMYQQANISFWLPQISQTDYRGREHMVIHELVHCLVDQMENENTRKDDLEKVVTLVTDAILSTKYSKTVRKKRG
jgi:hypothetical protein